MKRISLCWLVVVLGASAAVRSEPPRAESAGAGSSWPQIVRSEAADAGSRPGPKVYYFDVTGPAAQHSRHTPCAVSADGTRSVPATAATADGRLRPASAALHDTEPASLEFADPALPIEAPSQQPKYDPPPVVGGADTIPPPYDYAPPLWGPGAGGGLGGIPAFTRDYCPVYWGNPWEDYCCERWRQHCGRLYQTSGRVYQTPEELGEVPTPCCQACQGSQGEAPLPRPELPAIVPDRMAPDEVVPHKVVPDKADERISAPPDESPTPAKRHPPRNEIPKLPTSRGE
jgi:hypothetical protein